MRNSRVLLVVAGVGAVLALAALVVPASGGAQSADGALANFTPGTVKIFHTGGSVPSGGYADLGRLTIPSGSFSIAAHADLLSETASATAVDCFLVYPGTQDDPNALPPELLDMPAGTQDVGNTVTIGPASSGNSMEDVGLAAVTTTDTGGNVDLLCKVANASADRLVTAHDISVVATSVAGATVTNNEPPVQGTY